MGKKGDNKKLYTDDEIADRLRSGIPLTLAAGGAWGPSKQKRVKDIAKERGIDLPPSTANAGKTREEVLADRALREYFKNHGRRHLQIENGVVLIGSDAHYWPGLISPAHEAFLQFCKNLRPRAVILNGDVMDGATISRFPRIGWDSKPTVQDELATCIERMGEIEDAAGTKELYFPLGNHEIRYETNLAQHSPQYEGVPGFHLKDHFPLWRMCWAVWINDDVVVKHRFKGGIHAAHNNVMWSGRTLFTGHLHSLKVSPFSDYSGTRWGVDCGTLAAPYGPQFEDYTEDNPVNWRSGFVVATWHNGELLWPEVVHVKDNGDVVWRGTVMKNPNSPTSAGSGK